MRSLFLLIAASVLLTGCTIKQRNVPAFDDADGLRAILCDLSPRADGEPDPSKYCSSPSEAGSDRLLFAQWFDRYSSFHRFGLDKNEAQFSGKESVAEAIEAQRRWIAEAPQRNQRLAQEQRFGGVVVAEVQRLERMRIDRQLNERGQRYLEMTVSPEQASQLGPALDDCIARNLEIYRVSGGQALLAQPPCEKYWR
ncbi:hypothetical protein HY78_02115 [Rhizorhabdus wittichii DC-6]|nr:hypothetical protein HY78_02115 [Rhizorhabdus wittichii DC-6]